MSPVWPHGASDAVGASTPGTTTSTSALTVRLTCADGWSIAVWPRSAFSGVRG